MIIYPAIDIKDNQCVRLYQGDFNRKTVYDTTPLYMAKQYELLGATHLHVVDLDGAKDGLSAHTDLICEITEQTNLRIQTGGGIRDERIIKHYLSNGIQRVILGSIAVNNPEQTKKLLQTFGGEHILLAIDIQLTADQQPMALVHGWQENSNYTLWQLIDLYLPYGLKHILCTDIAKDGTMQGPNFSLYQQCVQRYPKLQIQASGGIANLDDLKTLKTIPVSGAIIGKALYENAFGLAEALAC